MKDMIQGFITKLKEEIKNIKNYSIKEFLYKYKISLLLCSIIILLGGLGIYVSLAYFNITSTHTVIGGTVDVIPDIEIQMYKKDTPTGTYTKVSSTEVNNTLPSIEYEYKRGTCLNGGTIDYNATTGQVKLNLSSEDTCKLYYDKLSNDVLGDINASIFVENHVKTSDGKVKGTGSYKYLGKSKLDNTVKYELNDEKSKCFNGSTANFDTSTQKLTIKSTKKDTCKVYLKISNIQ